MCLCESSKQSEHSVVLCDHQLIYPSNWSLTVYSLRPRASSSSSQSERSTSPLVMSSTHSLETMPRFALSTDDEGKSRLTECF